eukprot:tig00021350_g20627.t1
MLRLARNAAAGGLARQLTCLRAYASIHTNGNAMTDATAALADALVDGDRAALSRAVTLVESLRRDHQVQASHLLNRALALRAARRAPSDPPTFRMCISGPPGVGKSTFIEAFGRHIVEQGHRLAVLAIDPSSSRTGGSILGDKTRMAELSRDARAFVRPSPTGGTLGGVARRTDEAVALVECAGYDVVLVETVGVGQSEVSAVDMVDFFALLVSPGGGDELQGIKKGVVEVADLVLVNKADGPMLEVARQTKNEYASALRLLQPKSEHWRPKVMTMSAAAGAGVPEVWGEARAFWHAMRDAGELDRLRAQQRRRAMWRLIADELIARLHEHEGANAVARELEPRVQAAAAAPRWAAAAAVDAFLGGHAPLAPPPSC